jgi:hypothetical protein
MLTSVSTGAHLLRNMERRFFPRAFERRDKILHLGNFYMEFERYVEKGLVRGQLYS